MGRRRKLTQKDVEGGNGVSATQSTEPVETQVLGPREQQRLDAEKIASGPAISGRVAKRKTHGLQFVASGAKRTQRGRKRSIITEHRGWGIFNIDASFLVQNFFSRKTDVINHLELTEKMPWSKIKHEGHFLPVRVKISVDARDLKAAIV